MQRRGYAICTQPRSGSNLLCQYLASTGQLGHPLEYFNARARRELGLPDFPSDPKLQIEAVLGIGATPNGIYAVKLFASQLANVSRSVRWMDLLPNLHFVYLSRDDMLGQALSWARAMQTGQYRSAQSARQPAAYDAKLIQTCLVAIAQERARWEAFFARTGIEPRRIIYEAFLKDRSGHVDVIAELMGVENPAVDQQKLDLVIQRDITTEEWRQRFRNERGDPNVLDDLPVNLPPLLRKVRDRFRGRRMSRRPKA